ncbi:hypothetical protein COV17_01560 [Candidatus Woesearchaeota archaeon CG10_big_fil_rev_8_21_14_0_10_36_11]|nr:MAG: hypothetical protein COV17_01560 [Candidatus Woesearchaeota archaeon CG10_big_fil_rev_8_21_14_0_10_36_11]
MKKRTKKKIAKVVGKVVRGTAKLIFVYPPKAVWFVTKHTYYGIKNFKHPKKVNHVEESGGKNVYTHTEEDEKTHKGEIKHVATFDAFKEVRNLQGNLHLFNDALYKNKSTIGLIIGARGTGKSAIGMRMLENFNVKTTKKVYALGFKRQSLPEWITIIQNVNDIENNSVILIDEGGIEFSSRKSMSDSNTLLSEILLIARHKDLSVIFITQNSSNLEINVIRQADYLLLKPSSLLQPKFDS